MPLAAPNYVAKHTLSDCPPGHRFSLYYDGWNTQWKLAEGEKAASLRRLVKLVPEATDLLDHLRVRQEELAAQAADDRCLVIDAVSTSPFATGLGNEHPVENGFAFLAPYGLPYLAGSGVKGVLRRAAEELLQEGNTGLTQDVIDALFGPEDPAALGEGPPLPEDQRRRGALTFWDVLPDPKGRELDVEIMTPHYGAYYQGDDSPHDAGQPVPIPLLALPPGSRFTFIVMFEPAWLPKTLPSFDWKAVMSQAFERAFEWLGFGAKTAVGYGAMRPRDARSGAAPGAVAPTTKGAANETARTEIWEGARLSWKPNTQEMVAAHGTKVSAPVKGAAEASRLFDDPAAFERLKTKKELKNVRVEVRIDGNFVAVTRVMN